MDSRLGLTFAMALTILWVQAVLLRQTPRRRCP